MYTTFSDLKKKRKPLQSDAGHIQAYIEETNEQVEMTIHINHGDISWFLNKLPAEG